MVELVRRDVDIVMAEKKTPARIEKIFKGIRPINPESIILQSIIPDKKSSGKGNSDSGQSPPNSSQTDDKPSSDGAGDSGNDENSYNKDDEAGSSGAGNSGKDQSSSASTGETNQTPAPDPAPAPAPAAAPSAQPPPDLLAAPATPPPPTPAALALVVPAPASALAPAATVQVQAPASENAVVVTPRPPSETSASVLSPKSASIQTTEPSNGEKLVIVAGNGTNLQVNTGNLPMLQDNDRLPQNNASRPYTVEIFSQEWLVSGSYRWIRSAFCFLTSFVDCYWLPQNNPVPHINDPIRVDQNATFLIANLNLIDPSANIFDQNGNSTTKVLVGTPYHNPFQYPYNRYAHSFPDINNSTGYCGLYDLAFLLPSRTADLSTHKEESKNNQTITNAIGASSNSTISTIQPSNTKKAKGLSGWMCGDNLACQAILYGMPTDNLKKPKGLSGWICGDNSACQATLHGIPTGLFMALMSHLKIEDPALLGMGLGLIEELFPPVEFGLEYFILDKAFYGIIVGLEKCTPFLLFSPLAYAACVVPAVLVYSGVSSVAKVLKNAFTYFSIFNTKSVWYQFFSSCAEGTTTGRLISVITSYKAHLLLAGDYSLSKEAHEKLNALVDKGAKFSYTEKALGKCIRDQGKRNTTVVVDYTLGYFNASASESVITAPSTDWNNWIMDQAISVGTGCKNWVVYNAIPLVLTFVSYKYWRYMRQPAIGRGFNGANAYTVFEVRRQ